jgi:hypothetical protein
MLRYEILGKPILSLMRLKRKKKWIFPFENKMALPNN